MLSVSNVLSKLFDDKSDYSAGEEDPGIHAYRGQSEVRFSFFFYYNYSGMSNFDRYFIG